MKRVISAVLIIMILGVSSLCTVFAENGVIAKISSSSIYVNGGWANAQVYNIKGSNYFNLRDLAIALNGTSSQFSIIMSSKKGQIEIIKGQGYKSDEEVSYGFYQDSDIAYPTAFTLLVDDKAITVTAYRINDNNYFNLRDLSEIIPFYVDWDAERNIIYITSKLPVGAHKSGTSYQLARNGISYYFEIGAGTQNSYIMENKDGTINVIDISKNTIDSNSCINIETYDKNYNLVGSKSIAFELPLFGAFYSGDKFNYIAYGQENPEEEDNKEVVRIVKYTKDFTRVDSASVHGGESFTVEPFAASAGRMAENGNKLVFHTSRLRYRTEDGLRHQSQLTLIVDTDTMTVLNDLGEFQTNHVSHSFNQFVSYDENSHILVDHGDAYPRSIVLHKQNGTNDYIEVDLFKISGETGNNYTGVSAGGFEISSQNYIVALNSVNQSAFGKFKGINAYEREAILCIVQKDRLDSTEVKQNKITNYNGTNRCASIPKLVKISENKFMVLWQEILIRKGSNESSKLANSDYSLGAFKYLMIDGSGNAMGEIKTLSGGLLSNCDPILLGNQVVWYINQGGNRIFYTIPVD